MSGSKHLTKEPAVFDRVFEEALMARVAFCETGGAPYIVPLCFGRLGNALYFHTGVQGKKLDLLLECPKVGFELDVGADVVKNGEGACSYSMKFLSVVGSGRAIIVEDADERMLALDLISRKYSEQKSGFSYRPESVSRTVVIRLDIDYMTCKKKGNWE